MLESLDHQNHTVHAYPTARGQTPQEQPIPRDKLLKMRSPKGKRPKGGEYPLPMLGFGVWLENLILSRGSYNQFVQEHRIYRIRDWVYVKLPHPAIANELAPALSDWSGQEITVADVRRRIDPALEEDPIRFRDWLKQIIERQDTLCAFAYKYGIPQSTMHLWIGNGSAPSYGYVPRLAEWLTDWGYIPVTAEEIYSRINKDPVIRVRRQGDRAKVKT